jgi:hypothetical protein
MGEDILSMNTSDNGSTFFLGGGGAVPRKLNVRSHKPCFVMYFSPCFVVEISLLNIKLFLTNKCTIC